MATDLLERIYKLTVEGTQAERELQKISQSTASLDSTFKNLAGSLKKAAGAIGIGFAAAEFVSDIKHVIDSMDEAVKASQKLGLSVESFQEWQFALKLSGVESGSFATAVGKVAQGINDIDEGKLTDATRALRAFGVTAKDTTQSAMDKLVKGFSELSDGPKKTALALEIFGKAGKDLIPMLNSGAAGAAAMRTELAKLGGVFSPESAKQAEQFNDNLTRLSVAASATGRAIAADLLPVLVKLTNQWVENVKQSGFFAGTLNLIWQTITNNVGTAEEKLAALIKRQKEQASIPGISPMVLESLDKQIRAQRAIVDAERQLRAEREATEAQAKLDADARIAREVAEQKARDKAKADAKLVADLIRETESRLGVERGKAHAKWMDDQEHERESLRKTAEALAKSFDLQRTVLGDPSGQLTKGAQERLQVQSKLVQGSEDYQRALRDDVVVQQTLQEWLATGTEAQKEYAKAQFAAMNATNKNTDAAAKQTTAMDVLAQGATDFFNNLSHGVADFQDVFKRAVASVIAELLKLWAKKYIIDALSNFFSAGNPTGPNFVGPPAAVSASSGGATPMVGAQSMALTTQAQHANSGLSPLPRGKQANTVQVNVHNNAAGVSVDVRANEDGTRIDLIVERTRKALANEVRTGGGVFAKSLENTYALGRARAA
jgi:hypothetical protein